MILDIIIPGAPHAQGRARFARIGNHVRAYDPEESRDWKSYARQVMWKEVVKGPKPGGHVFIPGGPVEIQIFACFACTATDAKRKSLWAKAKDLLRWHTKKPDLDNIIKATKDAGKSILWADDSQVCSIHAVKITLPPEMTPFVRIKVCGIDDESPLRSYAYRPVGSL